MSRHVRTQITCHFRLARGPSPSLSEIQQTPPIVQDRRYIPTSSRYNYPAPQSFSKSLISRGYLAPYFRSLLQHVPHHWTIPRLRVTDKHFIATPSAVPRWSPTDYDQYYHTTATMSSSGSNSPATMEAAEEPRKKGGWATAESQPDILHAASQGTNISRSILTICQRCQRRQTVRHTPE
jgi:hypothetical protein